MTNTIYDQHEKAFANVSAYVLLKNGQQIGKVAFKYPKDGAGRLTCYLHIHGLKMVKGFAGGYGYDKTSAAFYDAAQKQAIVKLESWQSTTGYETEYADAKALLSVWKDGHDWTDNVRNAGFTVLQAV